MYLKSLSVDREHLVKALRETRHEGQRLHEPDYRIDPGYQNDSYPGRSFLAVFLPPNRSTRTQFFRELAYAVGIDAATRLAQRSRTVENEAEMVIYFPDVALTGDHVAA